MCLGLKGGIKFVSLKLNQLVCKQNHFTISL